MLQFWCRFPCSCRGSPGGASSWPHRFADAKSSNSSPYLMGRLRLTGADQAFSCDSPPSLPGSEITLLEALRGCCHCGQPSGAHRARSRISFGRCVDLLDCLNE